MFTVFSRSYDEFGPDMLAKIARQIGLNSAELRNLIDCKLYFDDYSELLRSRGLIE
ncbi:MAG: hypothetical protein HRF49_12220 [bacterium]